ncbi:MAG: VCBS repeat-containing protein, partial [Bacteroidales bacterium]|nr:VCBS repeat-containing protein [Bacteroidales bacterium]
MTIADLDQDGSAEIIHGRRVYSAAGQFLWEGSGDHGGETGYGILSIAADIDLSGTLEVIAGGTVYNADGSIKWRQPSIGSGFNAIGNFDDDDYPEIVVVSAGRLFLLEHTGEIIWGPVSLGGGTGGPPTVADVDGDGVPDIGVAGSQYFSVFASDGSLKWRQPISDFSSARTGSSVFDFQADGRAELVYADEQFLRVYDGATGTVLAQVPNISGTTLEYPVIADIDNSGSASIVVGANGGPAGNRGLKAYGSASNDWVGTRGLWNQHAYHINNINDDGTVPQVAEHSWLDHNTYRLNRFPGAGSREIHDLTLSLLTPIDNGAGNPLSASARIGNAGSLSSPATTVHIHRDSLTGPLLGTAHIGSLSPGIHMDVRIDGLQGLSHHDSLVAVVNPGGRFAECSGGNNVQSIQVDTVLGAVSLVTDSGSYGADATVLTSTTVTNTGVFDTDYLVYWLVEDASGNLVADLGQVGLPGVQSGASHTLSRNWNAAGVIAGSYRLVVLLHSSQGDELARQTVDFVVSATAKEGGPATVEASIASDKSRYQAWDRVQLRGQIKNNAINFPLATSEVELTVISPSGQQILSESWSVPVLAAQASQELETWLELADSPAGLYQVRLDVHPVAEGGPPATAATTFAVERSPLQSLAGATTATPSAVQRGIGVSCSHSVTNRSAVEAVQFELQYLLLKPASEEVISISTESMMLSPGQTHSHIMAVDTASLEAAGYSCLQQAVREGQTVPVSHAGLTVSTPPVELDGHPGNKGRLLVLFDGPARGCPGIRGTELHRYFGRKFHLWDIWSIKRCIHAGREEPHLSAELQQRLDYLMALLTDAGHSFTVVFNSADFESELFSGDYHGYILGQQKFTLPSDTEMILGEAVNRGAGLLATGASTRRNDALERALGISTTGLKLAAHGVRIAEDVLGSDWQAVTVSAADTQDFDSCGAHSLATYVNPWKNWLALRRCPSLFGPHPAATSHSYGDGNGVYLGFDSIAEAAWETTDADGTIHAALLRYSLDHIQPKDFPLHKGLVAPVTFTLDGATAETELELQVLLPDNLELVDGSLDFLPVEEQHNTW